MFTHNLYNIYVYIDLKIVTREEFKCSHHKAMIKVGEGYAITLNGSLTYVCYCDIFYLKNMYICVLIKN